MIDLSAPNYNSRVILLQCATLSVEALISSPCDDHLALSVEIGGGPAHKDCVDEKWLEIRGRWHYWFVVLDVHTKLPVLAALLPSRSQWACR